MGYLHIDGKGELANSGSRYNTLEADTLAAWLMDNQERIESHYGKPIQQVVGVVMPFSAQVSTIKQALGQHGLSAGSGDNTLTVGTVHSLQGAERAIVIFSPVYSKHEDGGFIDSDSSMLNVAVSRAKGSFLVFGDMDQFEVQPASSPRGLLKTYLFAEENNALYFAYKKRKDLESRETRVYTLHGVEQHDSFLNQTLDKAGKQITIVSLWLTWQIAHQISFEKALYSIRNNFPPGKLPPIEEYATTYFDMSEGGEVRGSWNSDENFEYVTNPPPAVDGGDGLASVVLPGPQQANLDAMKLRTASDPSVNPVTGTDLGSVPPIENETAKKAP